MSVERLLEQLHGTLLQHLLDKLRSGEEIKPADLEVARKFLADNNITADMLSSKNGKSLVSLVSRLPFAEDEAPTIRSN